MELTRKQKSKIAGRNMTTINNWVNGRYAMPQQIEFAFNCASQALDDVKNVKNARKIVHVAFNVYFEDCFREVIFLRDDEALDLFLKAGYKNSGIIRMYLGKRSEVVFCERLELKDEKH